MNEDIKQEIKTSGEMKQPADGKPIQNQNAVMQHIVQRMLPDDLKQNFNEQNKGDIETNSTQTLPPTTLDPRFVQKPIRTYERDLAEAMKKKSAGAPQEKKVPEKIKVPEKVKEVIKAEKPLEKKIPEVVIPPKKFEIAFSHPNMEGRLSNEILKSIDEATEKINQKFPEPAIRTYQGDIAQAVQDNKASTSTIIIAENKRKEEQKRAEEKKAPPQIKTAKPARIPLNFPIKQISLTFLGIAFIGGGIYGGYYLYRKSAFALPPSIQKTITVTGLIPSDIQVPFTLTQTTKSDDVISQIYTELNKHPSSAGKIYELEPSEINPDLNQKNPPPLRLTTSSFMAEAGIRMPDIIVRSASDRWMLGAYTEETGTNTLFVALSTDFFQNVFAGMLGWEKTMPQDLAPLFNERNISGQGAFTDKVIKNRDVREFRDPTGSLILLYSFVNKETLVITTTESSFIAIIDRIEKETYVR